MKVLAFNGSPHINGTTDAALSQVVQVLEARGIEVITVHVGLTKGGCTACGVCHTDSQSHCVIHDVLNDCIDLARNAEGFVFASPVYYGGIAGGMKCFMDRFFQAFGSQLQYKACACLAVARRAGTVDVFQAMNSYPMLANMLMVPTRYWSGTFGANPSQVVQDLEGMQNLRAVGTNLAWLLESLQAARKTVPLPEMEERVRTNFIR